MNIKLTRYEATEIIRDRFQKDVDFAVDIEIESAPGTVAPDADSEKKTIELMPLVEAIKSARTPFTGGSRKIAAIKAVRAEVESQGFFVGLADAKLFVEELISGRE